MEKNHSFYHVLEKFLKMVATILQSHLDFWKITFLLVLVGPYVCSLPFLESFSPGCAGEFWLACSQLSLLTGKEPTLPRGIFSSWTTYLQRRQLSFSWPADYLKRTRSTEIKEFFCWLAVQTRRLKKDNLISLTVLWNKSMRF